MIFVKSIKKIMIFVETICLDQTCFTDVADFVDRNRKLFSGISAFFLSLVGICFLLLNYYI